MCSSDLGDLRVQPGAPHLWLSAFILLRRGSKTEASQALANYLGRQIDEARELNETFLLRLWDQQEEAPEGHRLCFYHPVLPPSMTGLGRIFRRVPFAKAVLSLVLIPGLPGETRAIAKQLDPEIYVSYAWGEDSTPEGRKREEIVDRLCQAVRSTGREIGRDKERMRAGDSIQRFAQEISKAKRIVAVISEKSLHSEFCMAHELFRAYRRCDYQTPEFQEKIIALVIEDAKPFLEDTSALLSLARWWGDKLDALRRDLYQIDPQQRNHDLWIFVELLEEMVPRLPGMLAALKDIVMRRGFEEIMGNNFQEVIRRLPPD